MAVAWGILLVLISLLAWGGQVLSWLAPSTAVRLGVMESPDDVDPVYGADIDGEAAWDSLTLWTLLVAGVLLTADVAAWAYFGLVGGGMYLYFAGRGIVTRRVLRSRGFRVGAEGAVTTAYVGLAVWGLVALVTVVAAVRSLPTS